MASAQIPEQAPFRSDLDIESLEHDLRQPRVTFPAPHIEHVVRNVFRGAVWFYSDGDTLVAEKGLRDVSITYFSAGASAAPWDQTGIALRLHLDVGEMWIGSLRVAEPFRERGMGTQLVVAAEAVACAARIAQIHVFPLLAARSFWMRNAYRPHACTSRVLSKWVSTSRGRSTPLVNRHSPPARARRDGA